MRPWSPSPLPDGQSLSQLTDVVRRQLRLLAEALRAPGPEVVGVRTVTAATTVTDTDGLVRADATGGAFAVTLPSARTLLGHRVLVKRLNAGANAVTIAASGAETIDGAATKVLGAQYAAATLVAWQNGTTFGYDLF